MQVQPNYISLVVLIYAAAAVSKAEECVAENSQLSPKARRLGRQLLLAGVNENVASVFQMAQ